MGLPLHTGTQGAGEDGMMPLETSWHWVLRGAMGFLSAPSKAEAPGTGRRPADGAAQGETSTILGRV